MADAFRGLTLRIGADSRGLQTALNSVKTSAGQAQKQLSLMTKALSVNPTNVSAMKSSLSLMGDKAAMTARQIQLIRTAMGQTGNEVLHFNRNAELSGLSLERAAGRMREVYAATHETRAEMTSTNAQLQVIYDAVAKTVLETKKFSSLEQATKYVSELRRKMRGTGEAASAAAREMDNLVRSAAMKTNVAGAFGLEKGIGSSSQLVAIFHNLRTSTRELQQDLENLNKIQAFSEARIQLMSFNAELRSVASGMADMKAQMYAIGSAPGYAQAKAQAQGLAQATRTAADAAQRASAALKALPKDYEAAGLRARTLADHQLALYSELEAVNRGLDKLKANKAFNVQAAASRDVYVKFAKARQMVEDLEFAVRKADSRVEALNAELAQARKNPYDKTNRSVRKITAELSTAAKRAESFRQELASANQILERASMAREFREGQVAASGLRAEIERINRAAKGTGAILRITQSLRTMGYGLMSTLTPAIMRGMHAMVQAANDVDSAYRDMRKTVNGTEAEFEHLLSAALKFSTTHVTSADTILEIEAMGGQLGIAAKNLEGFGEVVSNLDVATNMDSDTIAENLGQLSNIMDDIKVHKDDPVEYQKAITSFSDALVRLGNNSAAQESNIMKVMMRIASIGNISGFTTPQLLAISTAVAATGQKSEAAGTAISRTFSQIESAVGRGGEKLEAFANVAGMTAEQFAYTWTHSPMEAFTAFIAGLKSIDSEGGSVANTLSDLGINAVRQRQTLMNLVTTLDVMEFSTNMAEDAWNGLGTAMGDGSIEEAGDAAREAGRKAEGFSGQLSILKNQAQALGVSMADGVTPMLSLGNAILSGLVPALNAMPQPAKTAINSILGLVGVAPMATIAVSSFMNAMEQIKSTRIEAVAAKHEKAAIRMAAAESAASAARAKNAAAMTRRLADAQRAAGNETAALVSLKRAEEFEASAARYSAVAASQNAASAGRLAKAKTWLGSTTLSLASAFGKTNGAMLAIVVAAAAAAVAIGILAYKTAKAADPNEKLTKSAQEAADAAEQAKVHYEAVADEMGENSDAALEAWAAYQRLNRTAQQTSETYRQMSARMAETAKAAREVAGEAGRQIASAESEKGAILDLISSIEALDGADDEESNAKRLAFISALNGKVDGLNLSAETLGSTVEGTSLTWQEFSKQAAKKLVFDEAINQLTDLTLEAENVKAAMRDIYEEFPSLEDMPDEQFEAVITALRSGYVGSWANNPIYSEMLRIDELRKAGAEVEAEMDAVVTRISDNTDITALYQKWIEGADVGAHTIEEYVDAYNKANNLEGDKAFNADDVRAFANEMESAAEASSDEEDSLVSLGQQIQDLAYEKFPALAKTMEECGVTEFQVAEWLDNLGVSFDEFSSAIENMANKAADGFNKIDTEGQAGLDDFMSNLSHNTEVMQAWGDNMETLWGYAGQDGASQYSEQFLTYLAGLGPETAATLASELANGDPAQFAAVADKYGSSFAEGAKAAIKSYGVGSELSKSMFGNIPDDADTAFGSVTASAEDSADAISAAFKDAGASMGASIVNAVSSSESSLARLSSQSMTARAHLMAVKSTTDEARTWGQHFVENLAAGMEDRVSYLFKMSSFIASVLQKQLGHSVPKEGPLHDDDKWGGHFVDNIANGIYANIGELRSASYNAAAAIADGWRVADVEGPRVRQGAGEAGSTVPTTVYNITIDGASIRGDARLEADFANLMNDLAALGAM